MNNNYVVVFDARRVEALTNLLDFIHGANVFVPQNIHEDIQIMSYVLQYINEGNKYV